ncbi:MAG TPA: hypothetical protein VJH63_00540 [Candidatus Paceibacterota bacterium]
MLEKLRKLRPDTKKTIVKTVAGTITFFVFIGWALNFSETFSGAYESTKSKGAVVYSFMEQNVEKAYNAFRQIVSKKEEIQNATSSASEAIGTASSSDPQ